eukprot:3173130-Karenia_brevis.AAC.1
MALLEEAFNRFTTRMQAEQENIYQKTQLSLQKYGQELLMSVSQIVEARVRPIQKTVDDHSVELAALRKLVASLERKCDAKIEVVEKQIEMDASKFAK